MKKSFMNSVALTYKVVTGTLVLHYIYTKIK
jgi:hypothetical protein